MRYRCRKLNMPHSLAPDYRASNFNSAFFADNIFIADSAIFPAITFIILFRSEYFLIKETPTLAPAGAIIYRFRLGHFSKRPFFYLLGKLNVELCDQNQLCLKF